MACSSRARPDMRRASMTISSTRSSHCENSYSPLSPSPSVSPLWLLLLRLLPSCCCAPSSCPSNDCSQMHCLSGPEWGCTMADDCQCGMLLQGLCVWCQIEASALANILEMVIILVP